MKLTGEAVTNSVNIDDDCTYDWTASLLTTAGASCTVGNHCRSGLTDGSVTTTLETGDCNTVQSVTATVAAYSRDAVVGVDVNNDGDFDGRGRHGTCRGH